MNNAENIFPMEAEMEIISCGKCGVYYALTRSFIRNRRQNQEAFYCPNGHPRIFVFETEEDRLRKALREAEDSADWHKRRADRSDRNAKSAQQKAAGYKGAFVKVKKRVEAGVCPYCKRSFQNLKKHMETKHKCGTNES